jgi:NNP family nitrate/nitrite transporter-like MFS transporter
VDARQVHQILAALSGLGGGNFASSMSNISFFYPKRVQGTSLVLNAGPGNFGVTTMQVLVPLVMTAGGLYLLLPPPTGLGLLSKWIVLPLVIAATVLLMRYLTRGELQANLKRQFQIFNDKHAWAMTIIYTMTFGSFIGYSAAFALAIKVIFGFNHVMGSDGIMLNDAVNPNGPSALTYAWMGPFIGALIRLVGGWISDRLGGAAVTQVVSIVMIASALGAAYFMNAAYKSANPEEYFLPFFLLFIVLFTATGVGNGSTFRTIAVVFNAEQAGPVLGWTSAVAAYGAFLIPKVFGEQIKATTPEYARYGFAVFYFLCLKLHWWFYMRPGAYVKNP